MRAKIEEELGEIEAVAEGDDAHRAEELGDLLFAVANWARHLEVDPEESLRLANAKFERRFRAMEKLAAERALVLKVAHAGRMGWPLERGQVRKNRGKSRRFRRSVRIHRLLRTLAPRSGYPSTDGGYMSISSRKIVVTLVAAAVAAASAGAFAQDRYDDRPYDNRPYDQGPYEQGPNAVATTMAPTTTPAWSTFSRWSLVCVSVRRSANAGMKPASTIVATATARCRVPQPVARCSVASWARSSATRSARPGRDAATAVGAVVGAAVGSQQAQRRAAYASAPPQSYTVQRCETRYRDEWQERTDGYRVTYVYNGRRQVTEMPNRPGDRIRVRVDVSPAE